MRLRSLNDSDLARFFLVALLLAGLYSAWSGAAPEELAFVPCPFRLVTDIPCPGCGMTRSSIALARGDFAAAWKHHPFAYGLVGLAVGVALFPAAQRTCPVIPECFKTRPTGAVSFGRAPARTR